MQCWYSYSYHNNRYIFGQGGMTCLRSSKRALKPSKTKYPLGKHPNNLMPYKIIPSYGIGAQMPIGTTTAVHGWVVPVAAVMPLVCAGTDWTRSSAGIGTTAGLPPIMPVLVLCPPAVAPVHKLYNPQLTYFYQIIAISCGFFLRFKNGVFLPPLFVTSFLSSCRQERMRKKKNILFFSYDTGTTKDERLL